MAGTVKTMPLERAKKLLEQKKKGLPVDDGDLAEAQKAVAEHEAAEKKRAEAEAARKANKGKPDKDPNALQPAEKADEESPPKSEKPPPKSDKDTTKKPDGKENPPPPAETDGGTDSTPPAGQNTVTDDSGKQFMEMLTNMSKNPALAQGFFGLLNTAMTNQHNAQQNALNRNWKSEENDKSVTHGGYHGRSVSGFHATMDSNGRIKMHGGSRANFGGRGGSSSRGGGGGGYADGGYDPYDRRVLAPTRMGTHIGAARHPNEAAALALDWMPKDMWEKDGIDFDASDFYRHSDRRRSGRFAGGYLSEDFRNKFMNAYMNGVGPDDPNYERARAMANAAYSRAMTRYSDEFQKYGKTMMQKQQRKWAQEHPEEAKKQREQRRRAAEQKEWADRINAAQAEATRIGLVNTVKQVNESTALRREALENAAAHGMSPSMAEAHADRVAGSYGKPNSMVVRYPNGMEEIRYGKTAKDLQREKDAAEAAVAASEPERHQGKLARLRQELIDRKSEVLNVPAPDDIDREEEADRKARQQDGGGGASLPNSLEQPNAVATPQPQKDPNILLAENAGYQNAAQATANGSTPKPDLMTSMQNYSMKGKSSQQILQDALAFIDQGQAELKESAAKREQTFAARRDANRAAYEQGKAERAARHAAEDSARQENNRRELEALRESHQAQRDADSRKAADDYLSAKIASNSQRDREQSARAQQRKQNIINANKASLPVSRLPSDIIRDVRKKKIANANWLTRPFHKLAGMAEFSAYTDVNAAKAENRAWNRVQNDPEMWKAMTPRERQQYRDEGFLNTPVTPRGLEALQKSGIFGR